MNIFNKKFITIIILLIYTLNTAKSFEIFDKNNNAKIKLYGNINASYIYSKEKKKNEDNTTILLGLIGKTIKSKNISIFGRLEQYLFTNITNNINYQDNIKNNSKTNIAFAGISNKKLGSISYGRNYSNIYDTLSFTDLVIYDKSFFIQNDISTGTNNNLLTYKKTIKFNSNPLIKNIYLTFQFQGKNNKGDTIEGILKSTGPGWGLSFTYDSPYNISISSSYSLKKRDIRQTTNINNPSIYYGIENKENITWSNGIKFNLNNLYIATTYSSGEYITPLHTFQPVNNRVTIEKYGFAQKSKNLSIIAQYNIPKLYIKPTVKYVLTSINNIENIRNKHKNYYSLNIEKYINIGTEFFFNKSLYSYINYKINKAKNTNNISDINYQNNINVGFVYKF